VDGVIGGMTDVSMLPPPSFHADSTLAAKTQEIAVVSGRDPLS
jgi:hypothetical protein